MSDESDLRNLPKIASKAHRFRLVRKKIQYLLVVRSTKTNQASTKGDDEGVRVLAINQSVQGSKGSINSFTSLHLADDDPVEAIE